MTMKDHYTYNVYSKYNQDIHHIGKVMDFSFKGVIFEGDSKIISDSVLHGIHAVIPYPIQRLIAICYD